MASSLSWWFIPLCFPDSKKTCRFSERLFSTILKVSIGWLKLTVIYTYPMTPVLDPNDLAVPRPEKCNEFQVNAQCYHPCIVQFIKTFQALGCLGCWLLVFVGKGPWFVSWLFCSIYFWDVWMCKLEVFFFNTSFLRLKVENANRSSFGNGVFMCFLHVFSFSDDWHSSIEGTCFFCQDLGSEK